jgi:diaminopimelate decarboxylase
LNVFIQTLFWFSMYCFKIAMGARLLFKFLMPLICSIIQPSFLMSRFAPFIPTAEAWGFPANFGKITSMDRLNLFPDTITVEHGSMHIGGFDLAELADRFGTPLYLYDRLTLDNAVVAYQTALAESYPGAHRLTYAGKAFLCLAVAEWTQLHGLWVDCTGLGEISIAIAAGVPRERLLAHGVNKSAEDIETASEHAGVLVVDNLTELRRLVGITRPRSLPDLWLRFRPGLAVETHAYTQTGHTGSKFGMDAAQILLAAQICREHAIPLTGLHFHQGSQFRDPAPLIWGIESALDLARKIGFGEGWTLSPGGGWGVAYHEDELPHPDLADYIRLVAGTLVRGCKERNLSLPCLHLEPGRSLVARAGVVLYRVGVVKQAAGRVWALLDGGMADNPRPALYGARYSALPVRNPGRPIKAPVWFAGPYCESGDVLIEALPFPEVREGDLVAVPVSGAYQLSMSSNYNGARRPAVVWLDQGQVQIIQVRESADDLFRRDHRLVKPAGKG